MLNLSSTLIAEKNKLSSDSAWLVLLDITVPNYGSTIRLVKNNEDIVFGGNTYTAFPMEIDTSKWTSKGDIPSLNIMVSNIANTFNQILREYDGGVGGTVTFTIVSSKHLTEDYAELQREFEILETSVDSYWVTFTLGSSNPLRQRFPLYTYMAHYCNWVQNFKGAECKYVSNSLLTDNFTSLSSSWVAYGTGEGETSSVVSATASDGRALSVGNNSGNDQTWRIHGTNIAYNPNNLYRVRIKIRRTLGTGTFYCGVAGIASDGTSFVNAAGNNLYTGQHYLVASNVAATGSFVEHIGYFTGHAGTGSNTACPDSENPGVLHTNCAYFRPVFIVNFNGAAGTYEIDYVIVEVYSAACNGTWAQCQQYQNTENFGGFPGLYNPEVQIV